MASPPPLNQTPRPPPPLAPVPQPRGNMYPQMWNYPINPMPNHQQQFSSYPPPPQQPTESVYPPPPPPSQPTPSGQMYFPNSQYTQFNNQPMQPPPPPPLSPPSSSIPPPPPPLSQPPSPPPPPSSSISVTNQTKEHRQSEFKEFGKDVRGSKRGEHEHELSRLHHQVGSKQDGKVSSLPPVPVSKSNRVEVEEERRMRKKRELEKQRQEEKHRKQLKESQNKILQKTQMLSSTGKPRGSIGGSHIGERKATPFLSGERTENRLKKPTTFLCKLK